MGMVGLAKLWLCRTGVMRAKYQREQETAEHCGNVKEGWGLGRNRGGDTTRWEQHHVKVVNNVRHLTSY